MKEDTVERTIYETYYPELIATFTGNLLADTVLYPLETVIHRLCLQGTRTIIDNTDSGLGVVPIITRYEGMMDCFYSIVSQEGVMGFYKGFGALVLQYGLHMAIVKLTKMVFERLSQRSRTGPAGAPMMYTPRSGARPPGQGTSSMAPGGPGMRGPVPRGNSPYVGSMSPGGAWEAGAGTSGASTGVPMQRPPAQRPRPDVPHRAAHLFQ